MATKPVIKKSAPVAKPVTEKKTRNRETVLLKVTASKLKDLIGPDTEIGVSRKELKNLLLKKQSEGVLAAAGL